MLTWWNDNRACNYAHVLIRLSIWKIDVTPQHQNTVKIIQKADLYFPIKVPIEGQVHYCTIMNYIINKLYILVELHICIQIDI